MFLYKAAAARRLRKLARAARAVRMCKYAADNQTAATGAEVARDAYEAASKGFDRGTYVMQYGAPLLTGAVGAGIGGLGTALIARIAKAKRPGLWALGGALGGGLLTGGLTAYAVSPTAAAVRKTKQKAEKLVGADETLADTSNS